MCLKKLTYRVLRIDFRINIYFIKLTVLEEMTWKLEWRTLVEINPNWRENGSYTLANKNSSSFFVNFKSGQTLVKLLKKIYSCFLQIIKNKVRNSKIILAWYFTYQIGHIWVLIIFILGLVDVYLVIYIFICFLSVRCSAKKKKENS